MPIRSAGLLLYRLREGKPEVLLIHPGGPLWARKQDGAWSIPKGQIEPNEEPLDAARREFREETGSEVTGVYVKLAPVRMKSGKIIDAWAIESDFDLASFRSITFEMEWPPRSGKTQQFPEADDCRFFDLSAARRYIHPAQAPLLDELEKHIQTT